MKIVFVFVLMFAGITLFAEDSLVIQKTIIYKNIGGKDLKVDVFYTESSQQKQGNTALAFFHGGGWVFGSSEEFFEGCKWFAKKGYVSFSFQYRLSRNADGSYPNPEITPVESVKDARSAMRWLREKAGEFKINPDRIVAGGQSAGGQLALSTALVDEINEPTDNMKISPVPDALLLYSSNVNTLEPWIDMLLGGRSKEIWSISPFHHLKKNMPPAIAFHGEEDNQVLPYIVGMFKAKTTELGNYFELHTYPGKKHYLGTEKYSRYFDEEILEKSVKFLHKFDF